MHRVRAQRESRQQAALQPQARRPCRRLQQSGNIGRSFTTRP